MESLIGILPWVQMALAILLTGSILLQQRGSGIGGAFGGDDSSIHFERRGAEKTLFRATILFAILFVASIFLYDAFKEPVADTASSNRTDNQATTGTTTTTQDAATNSNGPSIDLNPTAGVEIENVTLPVDSSANE